MSEGARIEEAVWKLRQTSPEQRTAELNKIVNEGNLSFNALLITALREAEVWPMGCSEESET